MDTVGYIPIHKDDQHLLPTFLEAWDRVNASSGITLKLLVDVDNPVTETCGLETHPMVWNKKGAVAPFFIRSLLDAAHKDGASLVLKLDVDTVHLKPIDVSMRKQRRIVGYQHAEDEGLFYGACYSLDIQSLEAIHEYLLDGNSCYDAEDKDVSNAARRLGLNRFLLPSKHRFCGLDETAFTGSYDHSVVNFNLVHCGQCGKSEWGRKLTQMVMERVFELSKGRTPDTTIDLSHVFGRVVVINLDSRPDRWEHFKYQAAKAGFHGYERVRAVCGDDAPHPHWWRAGNGAWGCLMSHLRVAQDALMDKLPNYLVFEDDVILSEDFLERALEAAVLLEDKPWDMLYLGGQHLWMETSPPWHFDEGIVRCNNVNRTHAFVVNGQFMQKFVQHIMHAPDYIEAHVKPEWDEKGELVTREWFPHVDHQLGNLHREYVTLALQPWVCGQAESSSNITGQVAQENWWDDNGWGK